MKHIGRAFYLKPAEIQPLSQEEEIHSCTVSVMNTSIESDVTNSNILEE